MKIFFEKRLTKIDFLSGEWSMARRSDA